MRSHAWLVDFEDSFTYNIAAEVEKQGLSCEIVPWQRLRDPFASKGVELPQLIILGPGPGHPDEYGVGPRLSTLWSTGIPLCGICLGHQLIGQLLGLDVVRSKNPLHGEKQKLSVPPRWQKLGLPASVEVQRYNSLAVKAQARLPDGWEGWVHEGEYMGFAHARAISYQFHPESVGTSCPEAFFRPLCRTSL